jgi:cyclopropane-fatty-acyl-phospholipid synthase
MAQSNGRVRRQRPLASTGPLANVWIRVLLRIAGRINAGQLSLVLADGSSYVFSGDGERNPRAVLEIRRPRAVRRLLLSGSNGFAEAYMDGDWDTPDLRALLQLAQVNEAALGGSITGLAISRWIDRARHLTRANSRRGSRRNIAYHYDLGNRFYELWLDASLTYSAALFDDRDLTLEAAQERKIRRIAETIDLRAGQYVLEIGCGWGGFAITAARDYGCRVTAITVSKAQFDHTTARVRDAGLQDRIEVRLQDYRDVEDTYDRIVSIEMFEAVGEEHWPTFFDVIRRRLKPGGIAGLQIITIDNARFTQYSRGADFIQTYIFPGGMLPSPAMLESEIARAKLRLADVYAFGKSYAETLAQWHDRFQRAWPEIRRLGFDKRFKRMWAFYLAYCEAGFRTEAIDVAQYRIELS